MFEVLIFRFNLIYYKCLERKLAATEEYSGRGCLVSESDGGALVRRISLTCKVTDFMLAGLLTRNGGCRMWNTR